MTVKELIKKRRTIRKFSQKPISKNQLAAYIDAARLSPSAANLQPLKYVSVSTKDMTNKVFSTLKWAGYLNGEYTPKEDERPTAYIIVCVDKNLSKASYDMDIGAAVENIVLIALEEGVGSCWLASVNREQLQEIIGLEENLMISCVIALGYPLENPTTTEMQNGDVKYFLQDGRLIVPKRSLENIYLKSL